MNNFLFFAIDEFYDNWKKNVRVRSVDVSYICSVPKN